MTAIYIDKYGVKHIAPYSLNHHRCPERILRSTRSGKEHNNDNRNSTQTKKNIGG